MPDSQTRWNPLRQRFIASVPALVTAVAFAWPLLFADSYLPGTDRVSLTRAMQIEFIAAASGLFLLMPLLAMTTTAYGHAVRVIALLLLAWTFASAAHHYDGWRGVFTYVCLVIVSYGGGSLFLRDTLSRNTMAMLAAGRWVIWIFAFFPLVVYFDLGDGNISRWEGKVATIKFGATFFTIVFLLEFFVFSWVGHRVDRLLESRRAREAALDKHLEPRARFYSRLRRED